MQAEMCKQIGKTDIRIAPIGLGTLQWVNIHKPTGNSTSAGDNYREIFHTSLDIGINLVETA